MQSQPHQIDIQSEEAPNSMIDMQKDPQQKHHPGIQSEEEKSILGLLRGSPLTINHLCMETGKDPGQCAVILAKLELKGLIIYERGHYALTD